MAEKVKVDIKKQNSQQDNSKPYVYTFRPVHLETSVDVVQKYNHYSSAQQHFRAQDEKEAKKAANEELATEEIVEESTEQEVQESESRE